MKAAAADAHDDAVLAQQDRRAESRAIMVRRFRLMLSSPKRGRLATALRYAVQMNFSKSAVGCKIL
jgi:hypothetical protein